MNTSMNIFYLTFHLNVLYHTDKQREVNSKCNLKWPQQTHINVISELKCLYWLEFLL